MDIEIRTTHNKHTTMGETGKFHKLGNIGGGLWPPRPRQGTVAAPLLGGPGGRSPPAKIEFKHFKKQKIASPGT